MEEEVEEDLLEMGLEEDEGYIAQEEAESKEEKTKEKEDSKPALLKKQSGAPNKRASVSPPDKVMHTHTHTHTQLSLSLPRHSNRQKSACPAHARVFLATAHITHTSRRASSTGH